jgi:superfamily II DNA or RNA helicase
MGSGGSAGIRKLPEKFSMKEGFYEKLVTKALEAAISSERNAEMVREPLSDDNKSVILQRFLQQLIRQALDEMAETKIDGGEADMVQLVNEIIEKLHTYTQDTSLLGEKISEPAAVLKAYFYADRFVHRDVNAHLHSVFPVTGLSASELFTGSRAGISLDSELKKEMLSADQIWWLVSFVKFEGVRLFEQVFKTLAQQGTEIRIICTVYMGATDLKAIDFLSGFPNVRLRISYNTRHERLHAKSYLFRRNSGFHTAYIGSSNLSKSALTHGLEWNLKVTSQEIPHIIDKCAHTFETYWQDHEFIEYDPKKHREDLEKALQQSRKSTTGETGHDAFFDISPYPFQQEMLDRLSELRAKGETRNLVVAATGTGKTMISAFDFRRFRREHPTARFLFVCHREEILRQALSSFRQVLRDSDFGNLWYGGQNTDSYHQLFASIYTFNGRIDELNLAKDFYDYIIIDEVHHSAAGSYQKLLSRFEPRILMGLTATPERHDGADITAFFGHTVSAELRLPEALNKGLLCPFQYFGITDETDISRVSWRRGKYDSEELGIIYSEDTRRTDEILRNCKHYLRNHEDVRAIGFCVNQRHAIFMAMRFKQKGLSADVLTSEQSNNRIEILERFKRKKINYLFVVDILNEGVDIPEIDTLLFLRPTESMTVFLQQLGRGLRKAEGKEYLTVLDFIGNVHADYSFEHRFRAMLGKTHTRVRDEIEHDFPHLPLGCSIVLERTARDIVLQNISKRLKGGKQKLLQTIRKFKQDYAGDITLARFEEIMEVPLHQIYSHGLMWFELLSEADGKISPKVIFNNNLSRTLGRTWLAADSISYFKFLKDAIRSGFSIHNGVQEKHWMLMCYVDIFNEAPMAFDYNQLGKILDDLFSDENIQNEVAEYLELRISRHEAIEMDYNLGFETALKLHGRYSRNHISVCMNTWTLSKKYFTQSGVMNVDSIKAEALFVTLDKSGMEYNPSIMYKDYFINDSLFHWQSQNSTSPESPKGQSYILHRQIGKKIILFVREAIKGADELTMAYVCCGLLDYVSHEGSKPMSITWRMEVPPPPMLFQNGQKLAIG